MGRSTATAAKPKAKPRTKSEPALSEMQLFLKSLPDSIRAMRMKPASSATLLSCGQWEELEDGVRKCLAVITGRPLKEAVLIVRRFVKCNAEQLRGLPQRFHVWKDN